MGKALAAACPAARRVFEEVDDALGERLSALMFDGDAETLGLTENTQPALLAVSAAAAACLAERGGVTLPEVGRLVAGHSLGEYSALTVAGAFELADAARLLRLRGQAMQRAVPVGEGAMAAVIGLGFEDTSAIAEEAAAGEVCAAANDNAPGQVVVSGHRAAVERALALAADRGAKRTVMLQVSAPFHCPLMAPAAEEMAAALERVAIRRPTVPLVANVTAEATDDPDTIRALLRRQVTAPVRWRESVMAMRRLGIKEVVELGQGGVLTGLAARIDRQLRRSAIGEPAEVDRFLAELI
jgi:[acyl-carrier-protein] S-malonyltransferase